MATYGRSQPPALPFATPAERARALDDRQAYRRRLSEEASAAVHSIDIVEPHPGCFARLFRSCGRGHRHRRLLDPDLVDGVRTAVSGARSSGQKLAGVGAQASGAACGARPQSALTTAFFGRRIGASGAGGAEAQLAVALASIEDRLAQMEQKATAHRDQARKALSEGNKSAALRALKMAKACEQKCAKLSDLSVAIERQRDTLEDVGLQQSIAMALGAGVKNMKRAQLQLKGIEKVADDTAEMRDVADDLTHALAGLGETAFDDLSLDDDDLLAELESFAADGAGTQATEASDACTSRRDGSAEASATSVASFPSAPSRPLAASETPSAAAAAMAMDMTQ